MMGDKEFIILNDGTPTHSSFSYNTSEALDISITSADIFPQCTWSVQDHIESDHFPILIEFNKRQRVFQGAMSFFQFLRSFLQPPTKEISLSLGVATEYQTWLLEEMKLQLSLFLTTSQEMAGSTTKFEGR
ncbi:hypothetical protein TNIN_138321 [Trichonephila inaurata madagascariensis]|uniref:Endonuclease/exonuclease/phosphatase domain-containing protein n=1 Tax=Trichonephila inaurata madagascariensis TaxID=2747483 RepID=A0A8X6IZU4_9ARAC|nr:hypothetical protein TNIN_138321 [Trichonephila inaurata madagascariensis]